MSPNRNEPPSMAEAEKVRQYLACWFQLGKKVIVPRLNLEILPKRIFQGKDYSPEFEAVWQLITDEKNGDCYLEGTNHTIRDLLSPRWEVIDCARCDMPVPVVETGVQESSCVCGDMENWPNNELPPPRMPVDDKEILRRISQSLQQPPDLD